MASKSHEWSNLSCRNVLWRGDSCGFVGAATYGLLGTGQAQIIDIHQGDPWGSATLAWLRLSSQKSASRFDTSTMAPFQVNARTSRQPP
jgi:hypothetical protein